MELVQLADAFVEDGDYALDTSEQLRFASAVPVQFFGLSGFEQLLAAAREIGKTLPVRFLGLVTASNRR
ncbi:hypothetical protein [Roseibium aggregatum]|uniref:Uncharacterized protein n=1 Tax=Roseibium aggregatum TaxID=187304 RepID=A0A926S8J7_9HYPH|nr:hypothetical protein [Roseibium aggregatum]MBD1549655.1 hypothetical protein [Roseibium aggregatum]